MNSTTGIFRSTPVFIWMIACRLLFGHKLSLKGDGISEGRIGVPALAFARLSTKGLNTGAKKLFIAHVDS